ncbi:MAG: ROK family protein, partial [Blastocatellia bacterium]|nr:ROK family protein [Blastocatellia bacterium]
MKRGNARTVRQTRAQHIIGIGLEAGRITAALVDERARVLARQQADTPQRTTRAVAAAITRLILGASMAEDRGDSLIMAIGVSVPGHVDPESERVSLPERKNWTRVALGKMIEEGLSDSGYDIRTPPNERRAKAQAVLSAHPAIAIQPRVCCAAAAEAWVGGARGKEDLVYLSLGDEIEAGIIAGGRLLRGTGGTAGLAGWLSLSESFKQEYNAQGCFASEATSGALVRRALEEWSGNSSSTMLGKIIKADPLQLDAAMIIRAARGGDTLA